MTGAVPEPLRLESALLVFVDFLEGPLAAVDSTPAADLRRAAGALARAADLLGLPALQLRSPLSGIKAAPLPEVAAALPRARVVAHETNDAWETPEVVGAIAESGRRQLVFCGIATDVGVGLTALSAARGGFHAAILVDACGTVSAKAEQAALVRLAQAGVTLQSWSGFLGEVQRRYGGPKGPELLKIVNLGLGRNGRL